MKKYFLCSIGLIFSGIIAAQTNMLRGNIYRIPSNSGVKKLISSGASVFIPGIASGTTDDNGYYSLDLSHCDICTPGTTLTLRVNSEFGYAEKEVTLAKDPLKNADIEVQENNFLLLTGFVVEKGSGRFVNGIKIKASIQNAPPFPSVQTDEFGVFQIPINKEGITNQQAINLLLSDGMKRYKDLEKIEYINRYEPIKIEIEPSGPVQDPVASARSLAAEEAASNLQRLDNRLQTIAYSLHLNERDSFDAKFDKLVAKVSPVFLKDHQSNYGKLLIQTNISSLRQALNGNPMRQDFGKALVQVFISGNMQDDAQWVMKYLDQFAEVQWAEESLFSALEVFANNNDTTCTAAYLERLVTRWLTVRDRAKQYHLFALRLLHALRPPEATLQSLDLLRVLHPKHPLEQDEFYRLLETNVMEMEANTLRKIQVEEKMILCRNAALGVLDSIIKALAILPNDPAEEIARKAITLRSLGLIDESITAFATFGERFANTDTTAVPYSRAAVRFTSKIKVFNVSGGAYVASMNPGSNILKSGIRLGDIIIMIQDQSITSVNELTTTLGKIPVNTPFQVEILRFDEGINNFRQMQFKIAAKPFGGFFMTI